MSGCTVRVGRGINYVDLTDNKKICVVGDYISRVAYGGNAVGQTIKIGAEKYTIVGVLEAKVTDTSNQEGSSDDIVLLPYTFRNFRMDSKLPNTPTTKPVSA